MNHLAIGYRPKMVNTGMACIAKSRIVDKIIHIYIQIGDMEYIH